MWVVFSNRSLPILVSFFLLFLPCGLLGKTIEALAVAYYCIVEGALDQ